jgi:hypothetical protein
MIFIFLKNFFLGVLLQAVRAVSKNRPKYPMLDIPFEKKKLTSASKICLTRPRIADDNGWNGHLAADK